MTWAPAAEAAALSAHNRKSPDKHTRHKANVTTPSHGPAEGTRYCSSRLAAAEQSAVLQVAVRAPPRKPQASCASILKRIHPPMRRSHLKQ